MVLTKVRQIELCGRPNSLPVNFLNNGDLLLAERVSPDLEQLHRSSGGKPGVQFSPIDRGEKFIKPWNAHTITSLSAHYNTA